MKTKHSSKFVLSCFVSSCLCLIPTPCVIHSSPQRIQHEDKTLGLPWLVLTCLVVSWLGLSCRVVSCLVLSCVSLLVLCILSCVSCLVCLFLSCLVCLVCLILSCLVLCVLSCPVCLFLSCLVCLVLSCVSFLVSHSHPLCPNRRTQGRKNTRVVLSDLVLFCLVLSCLVLDPTATFVSYIVLVWSSLVLSCLSFVLPLFCLALIR